MQTMLASVVATALGAAGWTLLEYVLHRFVFHGAEPRRIGAREHRRHHAEVDYFAPWWQKALAAVAVTLLALPIAIGAAGLIPGVCFTAGFIAMYLLYEVLHRRAHTHPPRGAYGRWLRRNHFAHHFMNPRLAQGVTSPIWDRVFGTRLPVERVPVPRRLAMPWLVDAEGELLSAYAADYVLVGRARSDERSRRSDLEAAMANRSPEAEAGAGGGPEPRSARARGGNGMFASS